MDLTPATNFLLAMLAILNPLGKVPVWIEACQGCDASVRTRLATLVTVTATLLLLLFLWFGREILSFLGIDIPAFRVGGGIVILLIGIEMLRGQVVNVDPSAEDGAESAMERAKARFRDVVVPVAVPVLAGPGSITTAMLHGFRAEDWMDRALMGSVLAGVMALVWGVLLMGQRIQDLLGSLVLTVQTRIWGLLLTAIAAQMILVGLGEAFPSWVDWSSPIQDDIDSAAESR